MQEKALQFCIAGEMKFAREQWLHVKVSSSGAGILNSNYALSIFLGFIVFSFRFSSVPFGHTVYNCKILTKHFQAFGS